VCAHFLYSEFSASKARLFLAGTIKYCIIFFWFSVVSASVFAQQDNRIDSLKKALLASGEDTIKVNILNRLCGLLFYKAEFKAVLEYTNEEVNLSSKLGYVRGLANSFSIKGSAYEALANYEEAIKNMQTSLSYFEELKDKKNLSGCYNNLGNIYSDVGKYKEALKEYELALKIREEIKDKKGIAECYNNIGIIYKELNNYHEALKYYEAALKIKEEIEDNKLSIAGTNKNIGNIYCDLGNYPMALKYALSYLKINEEADNKQGMADAYNDIGQIYEDQKDLTEAMKYYVDAMEIEQKIGDELGVALSYNNIGGIFEIENKFEKALDNYKKSLKIHVEIGDSQELAMCYHNIANINDAMGNSSEALKNYLAALSISKNYQNKRGIASSQIDIGAVYIKLKKYAIAKKYINDGLAIGKNIGYKDAIISAYKYLANLDSLENDYKNAFEKYKLSILYRDSMLNETNSKLIAEMREKYETDKKQDSIALLSKDKALQIAETKKQKLTKDYFIGGFILLAFLSVFAYNNYRTRQKLKLQTLRNKIARDLHDDVGSTLNSLSIYSQVAKQNPEQHDEALDMISESSRKVIENMSDIIWTINPEIDNFEKIISRMRSLTYSLFKAKNIDFTFRADEELNETKMEIEKRRNFYFIFKEAVNNILKYAEATRVSLSLVTEGHFIMLTIRDNGKGFDTTRNFAEGNGLKNMNRRAKEMDALLNIESTIGEGTSIELKFRP
jgi:signal transduction histidine kinase